MSIASALGMWFLKAFPNPYPARTATFLKKVLLLSRIVRQVLLLT